MKTCMYGLKDANNTPILQFKLKTGPLGFLVAIQSIEGIMEELVCCERPSLKYIHLHNFIAKIKIEIIFNNHVSYTSQGTY